MDYLFEPMFLPIPAFAEDELELPPPGLAGLLSQLDVDSDPDFVETTCHSDNGMETCHLAGPPQQEFGRTLAMEAKKQQMAESQKRRSVDWRVKRAQAELSGSNYGGGRWWTRSVVVCPLCNFPICCIPYPPFKLRVESDKPKPHVLVDGKFLAMQAIVNLNCIVCNRTLVKSDIDALDEYIRRCKLGPFRPGQAYQLCHDAAMAPTQEKRVKAQKDLDRLRCAARHQLGKLQSIQESRMQHLNDGQESNPLENMEPALVEVKPKTSISSDSSTFAASSTASTGSPASVYIPDPEVLTKDFAALAA
mmetsp:Transcript_40839/g.73747  ORF Transcript_40839/g.73747 Transcript_40839/m.73747 type:complete len:306 (-) Transcript_40839:207-1124(-)